jgi:hypothetical protein
MRAPGPEEGVRAPHRSRTGVVCASSGAAHLALDTSRPPRMAVRSVVEHVYDRVGRAADAPEHWRCRRCGEKRSTSPVSAGEILEATRTDLVWIKRYED